MNDHPHDENDRSSADRPETGSNRADDRTLGGWAPVFQHGPLDRIGPYKVIEPLGRGGMGCVYLAEQTGPIHRQVAIKLTNAAANTERMLRRFDAERQALALMNHPNIAQVFDAGSTEGGQPYFVMEYVPGMPISDYCDEYRVDIPGRLKLMLAVCDGVHHAHQKGVIHRDLKPSNVLVKSGDDATPKIIDFGIAKAVDEPLTDQTLMTGDRILGTPAYMSPERIKVDGDIDTRADIYSLGVMLYELLTGELPLPMDETSYFEIASKVLTEDAARPSDRITAFDHERLSKIAGKRSTDGSSLRSGLRGDLDWITMKAMEKDRARRYESAAALAADIRRHLRREPVEAGPPSASYRIGRFIQRHLVGVVAGLLLVAALLVGIVGTSLQARRANREAARANLEADRANQEAEAAEQVSDFLVGLFEVSDPVNANGETITAREILDRGAERIATELADQPHVQAQLQHTMGRVYDGLGLYEPAGELYRSTYETERRLHDGPHEHLVAILQALGKLSHRITQYSAAEEYYRQAIEMSASLDSGDPVIEGNLLTVLGGVVGQQGRFEEAIDLQRQAIEIFRNNDNRRELAGVLMLEGILLTQSGHAQEADEVLIESLEILDSLNMGSKPTYAKALVARASTLRALGRQQEAEALYREAIAIAERVLDPEHPSVIESRLSLANVLFDQERYEEAAENYEWALAAANRRLGPDDLQTGMASLNLALLYTEIDEFEKARPLADRALEVFELQFGPDHYAVAMAATVVGMIQAKEGRTAEAESSYLRGIDIVERALGPSHPKYSEAVLAYAAFLGELGRYDEAESSYLEGIEVVERALGPSHPRYSGAVLAYAAFLDELGRHDEAADYRNRIETAAESAVDQAIP